MTAPPVRYVVVQSRATRWPSRRHLVSVVAAAVSWWARVPTRTLCSRAVPATWEIVAEYRTHRVRRYGLSCPQCETRIRRLNRRRGASR